MHIILVALHHPKIFQTSLKRIQEKSAKEMSSNITPSCKLHQLEGDFKGSGEEALRRLVILLQDTVNKYQEGEIKNVSILTDFNLGFSTTLSSPIHLLDKYINIELTDKHNQRFQTQNKNTASSADSSALAPSLIPVNLYFTGSGTTPNPESGMPQHTAKEIMALYGAGRGDVMSFLATSRPASRGSMTSPSLGGMTSPSLGSMTSPSLGSMTSPSLGGMTSLSLGSMTSPGLGSTTSPNIDSRGQTPQHTINDANVPPFPQLPSSLTALSSSPVPREASASTSSGGSSLFLREASASASSGGSSLFPRDSSSASYGFYEEFTPYSSATPRSVSAAFLSPNSDKGEDDDILTAVAETVEIEAAIETAASSGAAPATPVRKRPDHTILSFTRELLHSKSPVASPVKIRPGLFGTRSCNNTPVPSLIKSDTPSPQRPVLTVEVDDVTDINKSLSQLFK